MVIEEKSLSPSYIEQFCSQEFQQAYDEKLVERGGFDKRFIGLFSDQPHPPLRRRITNSEAPKK